MARGPQTPKKPKATKASANANAKSTKTSLKTKKKKKGPGGGPGGGGFGTPKEVSDAVYRFMCNEHSFGMTEWSRMELANAIGYANPRSEKFARGLKVLVSDEGLAEKGSGGGSLVLSSAGIARMHKDCNSGGGGGGKTIEEVHERFLVQLEQKCSCGAEKVRSLWDILKDRKVHKVNDVAKQLGYGNPRSFGNTKIIPLMKSMGLVSNEAGKGNVQMSDKPFPSNLVDP